MCKNIVSKFCRCCMKNGELNIFTSVFESRTIAQILEQIFQEKISSDDQLPKTICFQCSNKVISQFLFIKNYQKVRELLLDILKREHETSLSDVEKTIINYEVDSSDDDQPLSKLCEEQTECNIKRNGEKLVNDSESINLKETESKLDNLNLIECESSNNTFEENPKLESYSSYDIRERTDEISSYKDCNVLSQELIKQLEKHCKDTGHSFLRKFTCRVCSEKFISNTHLNDHMKIHNNERPFACNECGMTFTRNSNLKRHIKKHTGERSYFCEICSKGFVQKYALTVHMRLHNGETPYVCEICGKGHRVKTLLEQHMYKHKDNKSETLNKYQEYYRRYGKKSVECKICKKIVTRSALYNHMKAQHGDGLKKFLCNLCGKTYSTKMSLDVHMNIHTKKISYDCNICSKSFTHQNYLKTHLMMHSGERPHCCDLCGKTFVQRTHLHRHKKTHTGAKPYSCSYCHKAFALNENLKVHIRIHTKETTHHCSECGKGFFNSSSKKKHENNVHRKKIVSVSE